MAHVSCVFCQAALPPVPLLAAGTSVPCGRCRRVTQLFGFPALVKLATPAPPPLAMDPPGEGEAACFYSPNRRATKTCSHCGVMISDSWAAQWGSETVCLKCLEHLVEKKDQRFETSRTLWDNVALATACVPFSLVLWFAGFITAPASVLLALWHWNSPRSLVPRSRFRLIAALIIGLLQVAFFILVVVKMWQGFTTVSNPGTRHSIR